MSEDLNEILFQAAREGNLLVLQTVVNGVRMTMQDETMGQERNK